MATSFGIVEEKTFEADFFLDKLRSCSDLRDARFYLSAFIAASRSITFVLQKSLSGVNGFDDWYKAKQNLLKNDQLADFCHNARRLGIWLPNKPITPQKQPKEPNPGPDPFSRHQ